MTRAHRYNCWTLSGEQQRNKIIKENHSDVECIIFTGFLLEKFKIRYQWYPQRHLAEDNGTSASCVVPIVFARALLCQPHTVVSFKHTTESSADAYCRLLLALCLSAPFAMYHLARPAQFSNHSHVREWDNNRNRQRWRWVILIFSKNPLISHTIFDKKQYRAPRTGSSRMHQYKRRMRSN